MYHGSLDRPLIIYFHGGGWTIGDLDTHHPFCLHLADQTRCTVMSVDYRLAPEHPFPAAHNDALAASRWIIDNLNALAPNNGEVVIAGDSAGGNLTLATAARLPDEPRLRGCLMMYPAIQHYHAAMRSYTEHAKSGPLTTSIMRWFTDTYLDGLAPADPSVELMFPGRRTTLAGFPRSLLITAERDPLRDDGRRLANTLQRANVIVQHEHFDREAHGFPCSEGPTPGHERFMAITKTWIEAISAR
ncbi:MAG: alpha/beta hydrolase [Halieaceae bacterium]|nr:alpha/beta hydrolase [Halieaceae bacterium]